MSLRKTAHEEAAEQAGRDEVIANISDVADELTEQVAKLQAFVSQLRGGGDDKPTDVILRRVQ